MPPKQKLAPTPPDPFQGELFSTKVTSSAGSEVVSITDTPEGGVYPADVLLEEGVVTLYALASARAKEAAATRNRQEGGKGKHSALGEDGLYHPWVGSFLPGGFGKVTYTKWTEAKRHASMLNADVLRKRQLQPQLDDDGHAGDVFAAVAYVAARLDIGNGLQQEKPKSTLPPVANTQDKLMGLMFGEKAGFIPPTNREKNRAFEMMDYLIPGKYEKGAGKRLLEIFYSQQGTQQLAGKTYEEAHEMALDSVRSVVNEWGDYAENARASIKALKQIEHTIVGQDPQKFLGVTFRDGDRDGLDFRPLVRYFDLRALPYYPGDEAREAITTREDRMQISEEKNKTVEDEYTRGNMKPEYEERVEAVLKSMRVKDALLLIAHAIEDQENRGSLWVESLNSALEADDFTQYIQPVLDRVKAA